MKISIPFLATRFEQLPRYFENQAVEGVIFDRQDLDEPSWACVWKNMQEAVKLYQPENVTFHFPVNACDYTEDLFVRRRLEEVVKRASDMGLQGVVVHSNRIRSFDAWSRLNLSEERLKVVDALVHVSQSRTGTTTWMALENMPLMDNHGIEIDPLFCFPSDFQAVQDAGLPIVWDFCHYSNTLANNALARAKLQPSFYYPNLQEAELEDVLSLKGSIYHWHFSAFKGITNPTSSERCVEGVLPEQSTLGEAFYQRCFQILENMSSERDHVVLEIQDEDYTNRLCAPKMMSWINSQRRFYNKPIGEAIMNKSAVLCTALLMISSCMTKASESTVEEKSLMENQHRVLKQEQVDTQHVEEILGHLNLTPSGKPITPRDGRIATNLIIPTLEKDHVMVRVYPKQTPEKLETGCMDFEVEVLSYLRDNSQLAVPRPLTFSNGKPTMAIGDYVAMAYPLLPGKPLSQKELSPETATAAGSFLRDMLKVSTHFVPKLSPAPSGDLEYVDEIYLRRCKTHPVIADDPIYQEMRKFNQDASLRKRLAQTPKGFVHADYFFENTLMTPDQAHFSVVDFGDAYYGHVVMDAAIGAMEFSVPEDRDWDHTFFKSFLKPLHGWLQQHDIDAAFFLDLMKANCLRFAVYTAPFTLNDGDPITENPYRKRFLYLSNPKVQLEIKQAFNEK